MDRRHFLHLSGCTILAGLLGGCGSDSRSAAEPNGYSSSELIGVFAEQMPHYRAALGAVFGGGAVDPVTEAALVAFTNMAPTIPYIGPLQYPLPKTLAESCVALGFGKVLQSQGSGTPAIGQVIVEAFRESQRGISREQHLRDGERQFTDASYRVQASMAEASHRRHHSGDWVFDFISGNGDGFDWGLDFTECGILKFFRRHGMTELMPYICVLDFVISDLQGTGLQRSGTLADGASRCDFRYRKGRPVQVPVL